MQHHDFDCAHSSPFLIVIFFKVAIQSIININEFSLIGFATLTGTNIEQKKRVLPTKEELSKKHCVHLEMRTVTHHPRWLSLPIC